MKKIFDKIKSELVLKSIVFISIILLYFGRGLNDFRDVPYIEGDGFEYVLMTEAFYNHGSPDIRMEDVLSFKEQITKHYDYNSFPKKEYLESLEYSLKKTNRPFMECYNGLYNSKSNKVYSYHYFTYSLFSVIGKTFCTAFNYPPLKAFHLVNALLVVIVCFLLLFFFSESTIVSVFSALCFCFGVNYWYLGWEHTEVFTTCFVAIGLIFYFKRKTLLGLLFIAIATTQNQPLIVLLASLMFVTVLNDYFSKSIEIKKIIRIGVIGLIAITPMIFYYYNFNTTNLIKDLGFLDNRFITFNRVVGFYFDVNQGMILCLPLILPTYLIMLLLSLFGNKLSKVNKIEGSLILVSIVVISIIASTMGIWNAGQAIVNRYITWVSAIVFIHFIFLIQNYSSIIKMFLLNNFFISQLLVCFYFQSINIFDWEFFQHKHIADWFFENHPDLYNPDPAIFSTRTIGELDVKTKTNPVMYFDKNYKLRKVMFNQTDIPAIEKYFFDKSVIDRIKTYSSNFNWSYLKEEDLKFMIPDYQIYSEIKNERIKFYKDYLMNKPDFKQQLPERMKQLNKTEAEILEMDAIYYVSEEERKRNE